MEQEPDAGKDGRTTPLWFPHTFEPEIFFVVLSDFSHGERHISIIVCIMGFILLQRPGVTSSSVRLAR